MIDLAIWAARWFPGATARWTYRWRLRPDGLYELTAYWIVVGYGD